MAKTPLLGEEEQRDIEARLARIFAIAGCQTQAELARILSVPQSSISDAKKRGSIPSSWLVKLLRLRGVNPDWVLLGIEPKFLTPSADPMDASLPYESFPLTRAVDGQIIRKILRCFPVRDLLREVQRRKENVAATQRKEHI